MAGRDAAIHRYLGTGCRAYSYGIRRHISVILMHNGARTVRCVVDHMRCRTPCTVTINSTPPSYARVAQFRDQTQRFLRGELSEDEFRPLRLRNGLYIQKYAPMLRVAIPYGLLSAGQLRMLAHIARKYDRDYGHFTTRQNIQYNWPRLAEVPDILADLASVEMHAIQTSGNCVRNVTSDHLAGVAADELCDPRPWCELIRQWSTLHPEFTYLPRKFKIAVSASARDRAATAIHDIGLQSSARPMAAKSPSACWSAAAWAGSRSSGARSASSCRRGSAGLHRGDPARVQPLWPPRQHPQGAHQDPGEGADAPPNSRARSRPNGPPTARSRRGTVPRRGGAAGSRSSRSRPMRRCPPTASRTAPRAPAAGRSPRWARPQRADAQAPGLSRSVRVAEEARRRRRAT